MELFKKYFGLGITLIIFDEEVNDIMKILKSFKDSGLLIKRVRKTIKNEEKEQKQRFLGIIRHIRRKLTRKCVRGKN